MNIGSALVLLAVIWFMVFFVVLPIGLTTQGDAGKRLKGTSAGSPEGVDLWRKVRITSIFCRADLGGFCVADFQWACIGGDLGFLQCD